MKRKLIFISIILFLAGLVLAADSPYARRIRPGAFMACTENEITYDMTLHKLGICTNTGYQEIAIGTISYPVTSVFGRTGAIVAASNDYTFAQLASIPTTIAGYGITDFNSLGDARWSLLAHTHTFASLTSVPTTFSGYGISDTSANLKTAITDELGSGSLIFSAGTLNITSGKTLNVSNTLTFTATDGSTLAIGTGGTLGTNAFTSTSYAPLASPTFTGVVTIPAAAASAPGLAMSNSSTTGIYSDGASRVGFTIAGNSALLIDSNRNINTAGIIFLGNGAQSIGRISDGLIGIGSSSSSPNALGSLSLTGITMATAGTLTISSGTNKRAGNTTLVGGTVTVSNTTVTTNTIVILTRKTSGGTIGTSITYTLSAGASFTITSDNILDTSTFSYVLIENP